ncbi:MAG: lysophospholipid acyltransferase family protein [Bacillota bacterium]
MGKIMYWLAYIIVNLYFYLIQRWQVKGKQNRPRQGQLIVMANHISNLDPPIVGCVMNRQVHFMAKAELFTNPIVGWTFKKIGVFPIKRGKPDRKALKKAFKILESDKVLGIFPEGTRQQDGQLGQAKPGAVLIALHSQSPILPIGIKNSNNSQQIKVSIGEPFTLDQYYDRRLSREEKEEAGELIMKKIDEEIQSLSN